MAVGQNELQVGLSYVAIGRETALGTYNTCTAALDAISSSLKVTLERKVLEQLERSRVMSKDLALSKKIEGEIEAYFVPTLDSCAFLLQNAFGGTITSATATGETAGGLAFSHTFNVGSMDQSYPSLCINQRKGPSSGGKVFQYSGIRVNEIGFTAEIDEALKFNCSLIGMDATVGGTDVSSALTVTAEPVLSFDAGRVSVETSFAALTTTSFWHVQSAEFGWSNNLKSDQAARRIGSNILGVLPPGKMDPTLKVKMRFDTTTAFDAMMASTQLSAELEFLGSTLTGSAIRRGIKFQFPKLKVMDAGDPEISGPDGILQSDVTFAVLRDDSSATGYAVRAILTNLKSSYA
jgi:hypothetical protein